MKRKFTLLLVLSILFTTTAQGLGMPKWTTLVGGAVCTAGLGAAIYLSSDALELTCKLLKIANQYLTSQKEKDLSQPTTATANKPQNFSDDSDDDEPELYQAPDEYLTPQPEDFTAPEDPYVMYEPFKPKPDSN